MKLLFTCVGRRVELLQAFRKAESISHDGLSIIGTDISSSAPALFFCDKAILVPKINETEYISTLLEICKINRVDCLIPTIDTDLMLLSESKDSFSRIGTTVLISQSEKISLCRDKRLTAKYFNSLNLKTPTTADNIMQYNEGYPAFIKPLNGSSSNNAYVARTQAELEALSKIVPDYIIQPYITGREYTVDIFCDLSGNPIYITPRERLSVRSGEVLKTRICQDKIIISEMKRLIADFKPCGQITVQLIHDEVSGQNIYIEINPRFGGGAPLSMKAGADSAAALIQILQGETLSYTEYAACDGATFSRFDQSICINKGEKSDCRQ